MSDAVQLAAIGVLTIVINAFVIWMAKRQDAAIAAKNRREDYRRQDEVAARVEEATQVAAETASKLQQQLASIDAQGKQIHTLVNSEMTAARTNERDQTKLTLIALQRVQAMSKKLGIAVTADEIKAIKVAEERIVKLDQILADRLAAQKRVDKLAEAEEGVE